MKKIVQNYKKSKKFCQPLAESNFVVFNNNLFFV